jgi:3-hydroxyacyl-CoA dehydrogenase
LLATNTSSLAVSDLQAGLHHPERVVGLHFFNPVDKMPLVEVVRGRHTSDAALTRACALALQLEKTPVVVADVPGFLVNRILGPYLDEALALLAGGVPAADLDAALTQFGMPMGPLALLDEVGFDVAAHAAQTLVSAYGSRMGSQAWLGMAVQRGVLGKKTGRGFYLHAAPKGRPGARTERAQLDPQAANLLTPTAVRCELRTPDELATRLVAATCAEAFRCLEAGVTSSEEELDLAFVLGTGFAPFRGGPLHHTDALGASRVLRRLEELRAADAAEGRTRARFDAPALLVEHAKSGEPFHALLESGAA